MLFSALFIGAVLPLTALGQTVIGRPTGFASGTTGGGSAPPQIPANIAQLKQWLADSTPRTILLDKEYNFLGSAGKQTATGCRPPSNTCPGRGGQDAINGANWCQSSYPKVTVNYDKAALTPLQVGSNKSLIGLGNKGVLRGIGLRLSNNVKNVIIQNIHITELNPQYIWGGDAITLVGCDNVWIDHVKISLIGRQMIVAGYEPAGRVTISNTELDGRTSWSAMCNGKHYWTMLFLGKSDKITLVGNYIHDHSGRSPKVGQEGNTYIHAVNNLFSAIDGHAFEVLGGGKAVIEGNVFENVKTPITSASNKNNLWTTAGSGCQSRLGRACQANILTGSGALTSASASAALGGFSGSQIQVAQAAGAVKASVLANAGVGKIGVTGGIALGGGSGGLGVPTRDVVISPRATQA